MATLKPLADGGYYVDGRKRNGERVQKTFTPKRYGNKAKQKANELFEALILENSDLVESTLVKQSERKLSVSELAGRYREEHLKFTRATGNQSYLEIIKSKWGNYKINHMPMIDVRTWIHHFLDEKNYSPYTIRKIARYFIRIFNWGKEVKIITNNPLDDLLDINLKKRFARLCTSRKVSMDWSEFGKMVEKFPYRLKRTCLLSWYTGMRAGEICYLQWSKIHGDIIVKSNDETKEVKEKIIVLERGALDVLAEIQAEQLVQGIKTDRVFPGLNVVNNGKSFEHWRNSAGYSHIRFHDIRHMYKKRKRLEGHNERVVEAQMGHRTDRNMAGTYDNIDIEDLRKLAEEK